MEGKAWEASPAHERPVFLRGSVGGKSPLGDPLHPPQSCPRWREEKAQQWFMWLLGSELPVLGGVQAEVPQARPCRMDSSGESRGTWAGVGAEPAARRRSTSASRSTGGRWPSLTISPASTSSR